MESVPGNPNATETLRIQKMTMGLMQLQPKKLGDKEVGHMQRLRKGSVGVRVK